MNKDFSGTFAQPLVFLANDKVGGKNARPLSRIINIAPKPTESLAYSILFVFCIAEKLNLGFYLLWYKFCAQWWHGLQVVDVRVALARGLGNRTYPQWFAELPDIQSIIAILRYDELCMFSSSFILVGRQ